MYWFRAQSALSFIPWILTACAWFIGGWLIATHAFNADKNKRILLGFGLGLVLYLWLTNLLGHWLTPPQSYYASSILLFVVGLILSRRSHIQMFEPAVFKIWPILFIWAGVFLYALLLERGLMIYDDQLHLPAISVIAASRLPPKYFLNANDPFAYHYGFDLLGASLMRIGGMFAWSASDLSKALVWSFSLILTGLILNTYLKNTWKTIAGMIIFPFLGNTRYLLMLLPSNLLQTFDSAIGFLGVSSNMQVTFSQSLFMPWTVIPSPPRPFTFGFISGIYPSYHMYHTGLWPLALIIIGLIWLLSQNINSWKSIPFLAVLWSFLALTYESCYALFAAGVGISFVLQFVFRKKSVNKPLIYIFASFIISIPIALLQGGAVLNILQGALARFTGSPALVSVHDLTAEVFSINWPPTIFSSTFGDLSIFNIHQLIVGLLEIGPILFFMPQIMKWAWKKAVAGNWMAGSIAASTLLGFLAAIFLRYNPSRDAITRLMEFSITFWYLILIINLFEPELELKRWVRILVIISLVMVSVSGIANFFSQISAIPNPVLSDHITGLDARISSEVWGILPNDEIIFDPNPLPGRASEVTGLPTVIWQYRQVLPFWEELYENPSLEGIRQHHYRYVYIDERWWNGLSEAKKDSLSNPCIKIVAEASTDNEFRRLLDLEGCAAAS